MPSSNSRRVVPISGSHNLRDIGGYETRDGKVTGWRKVYRSGTLSEIEPEAVDALSDLGLKVVCDLRANPERALRPSRLPPGHDYLLLERDHETSSGDLAAVIRAPGLTADNAAMLMAGFYTRLAYEQAGSYRPLFQCLAEGRLSLLFHCAAGKDRTGVAAAILLDVLHVPRETIMEDYLVTQQFYERSHALFRAKREERREHVLDNDVWRPLLRADATYLNAMFAEIDRRHGSSEGYLNDELGIGPSDVAAIRANLLESS